MDSIFLEKMQKQERIQKIQEEIEKLLLIRPDLIPLQKEITQILDRVGDLASEEGRKNRAILSFALMQESMLMLVGRLKDLTHFKNEDSKKRRPHLSLIKPES